MKNVIFWPQTRTKEKKEKLTFVNEIKIWDHQIVDLDELYLVQIRISLYLFKNMDEVKLEDKIFYLVADEADRYQRSP